MRQSWWQQHRPHVARGSSEKPRGSTEFNKEGIQVGTAVALLIRKQQHCEAQTVAFRNLWWKEKRAELLASLAQPDASLYQMVTPALPLGLPFTPLTTGAEYTQWPLLPDLLPQAYPGVKTSRDDVVVSIDRERLLQRMEQYFDLNVSDDAIQQIAPGAMESGARFDPVATRRQLQDRGFLPENIVRFSYRPFDVRWLYWEPLSKLLDEKRADYFPQVFAGNQYLVTQQKPRRDWSMPQVIKSIGCLDLMDRERVAFPCSRARTVRAHWAKNTANPTRICRTRREII